MKKEQSTPSLENNDATCVFCHPEKGREIILETEFAYAIYDKFPVNPGHVLVIPVRHAAGYFDLTDEEQRGCWSLLNQVTEIIRQKFNPDGFNIGININSAAGQTIFHVHIHVIPRYSGDVVNPRGGVRNVVAGRGDY
jgi:diadenosine tetraphosphate (Ap4A) HIT family hydrolase